MGESVKPPATAVLAREMYEERRRRDEAFSGQAGLFADPAWDLLLDLYVAHYQHYAVSISSACIAASVPMTSALRWINALIERGMLHREQDPFDRRRSHLRLTPGTLKALDAYFSDILTARGDNRVAADRRMPLADPPQAKQEMSALEARVRGIADELARLKGK